MKALFFLGLSLTLLFGLSQYEVSEKIKHMTFQEYKEYIKSDEYKQSMQQTVEKPEKKATKTTHPEPTRNNNCEKVIVLHSAKRLAQEYGKTEKWIYAAGIMINLWEKPSSQGKGHKVGQMYPGSHANILEETTDDYKVISPLDKSVGWINKIQVSRTQFQDSKTRKECTP